MGLIQRVVEAAGLPTVSISINRLLTEQVRPPRAFFVRWPFGHPFGEPFNVAQQRTVLRGLLRGLAEIDRPGTLIDLPYKWKREKYTG